MALEASAKEIAMYANGVCSAISFFISRPIFRSECQKTDSVIGPILFFLKGGFNEHVPTSIKRTFRKIIPFI